MKNLVVLYLIYGNENLDNGLIEIDKITNRMFENLDKKYVIIDNSNTHQLTTVDNKHYIHGNNDYFDFSGWDVGFEYASKNFTIDEKTMFLFVNDTFFQNSVSLASVSSHMDIMCIIWYSSLGLLCRISRPFDSPCPYST